MGTKSCTNAILMASTKTAQSGNCDKNVGLMEEKALGLTIVGAAGMAFFAGGFLSLRVARLVKRPVVPTTWALGNSQSESA